MPLSLFNTLGRTKEEFTPLQKKSVTMYTCGPTVYSRPHIGNYASFLLADLLRRWLQIVGFTVTHVKNITDVGHLAADNVADAEGEDKIERQARAENVDPLDVARKYTDQYLEDEKALNMLEPARRPKATEMIKGIIEMIQSLIKKGHAYETEDGIYFAVQSFSAYGKLSGNTLANLGKLQPTPRMAGLLPAGEEGVRIDVKESKKHSADFALWKKCVGQNANHLLRWSFDTGEKLSGTAEDPGAGFPGWHIECSVMSTELLGKEFDIHTGGEDLIFPHHECEIAQSQCSNGKPPVRYWLHRRFIDMDDKKMSKSLGNVLNLSDIEERGFSALDLRYLLMSTHYRSHTHFTWKALEDAKKARLRVVEWVEEVHGGCYEGYEGYEGSEGYEGYEGLGGLGEKFIEAMNDDLNTPEALAVVFELMAWSRQSKDRLQSSSLKRFIDMLEQTFGCFASESVKIPSEIQKLVDKREAARAARDYKKSDELRDAVFKKGYIIEDLPDGPKILPKNRRSGV